MKIKTEILSIAATLEKERGFISIPFLQWKMKLSYKQAKAIIDILEEDKDE